MKQAASVAEEDVRWRAWLAERGRDVVVHDGNVHKYSRMRTPAHRTAAQTLPVSPPEKEADIWDALGRPPPGMGARFEHYAWRQTVQWVELSMPLPRGTRARDVLVAITKSHVRVQLKADPSPMLDAELARPVYVGEGVGEEGSHWQLIDRRVLKLYLNKWHSRERANCRDASETWWPSCLAGEPQCAPRPPVEYYSTRDADGWRFGGGIQFAG